MPDDARSDPAATEQPGRLVRDLRGRIDRSAGGDAAAALRLELGRALLAQARVVEAVRELEALAVEPGCPSEIRAAALGSLAGALALSGRTAESEAIAGEVLDSPDADAESRVLARSAIRGLRFFEGRFDEAVEHAIQIVRDARDAGPVARAEARLDMGGMLYHADRFDEAEPWFALDADASEGQRQEAAGTLAQMNLVRGRWRDVLDALPAGGGTADPDWSDLSHVVRPAIRAHALLHLDRAEVARRELGRPVVPGAPPISLVAAALLAELDGDLRSVGALIERAVALGGDPRFRPQIRTWAVELVRLALAAGERPAAQRVVDTLEALAAMSTVRSVAAASLAVRGMVERDPALLANAAELFAEGPRMVAAAQTLEELGVAHAQREERDPAVAALQQALASWRALDAPADVRRVARRLADLGVRTRPVARPSESRTGWDALSPTEATVAMLVGEGMTNAEIASRLVVSPRTVETHVAHVLAKLEVRTRAGIARHAAGRS
ncbi:MAG TPA: helix-turn-helix transcriptional regulator [Candidatus Limnocylindria bacterium]|nr:helix-turn-helix transcriptional regulator [Candidatus Limnocylindria bacterium]